ncbi:hypothetical protein Taro_014841 [Colocasia esculenta]|uniref:RING-type E3 ubiquitin transferase n=1 Tax=Colocasia esculenta TaxID=4460 RepID=A0A843UFS4_COLES|nr:hypothetical protein [Colocasia esculenta]
MGNSLGCSASGERLVSAARDGDLVEARMLLAFNPCLARYSTFGGLNSPLHFAAAKGHNEIVMLLLENGADVNSRNYCGQTALMQACRYGHWEVVQTLLLFRCNVTRADYLSGRTALHFAAIDGHVRCMRLVVADFLPSVPYESVSSSRNVIPSNGGSSPSGHKYDSRFIFLFQVTTSIDMPVDRFWKHSFALRCMWRKSQVLPGIIIYTLFLFILLAKGASRLTLNCNGECALQTAVLSDDGDACAVCLERACTVAAEGCAHELCVKCALYLCSTSIVTSEMVSTPGSIPCPLCRHGIVSFVKLPMTPAKELKPNLALSFCSPCMLHPCDTDMPPSICKSEIRKNRVASVSSEVICPVSCSPFPSLSITAGSCHDCSCHSDSCTSLEPNGERREQSSGRSQGTSVEQGKIQEQRLEKTSCSNMFRHKRSSHREQQCDSEISA